LFGILLVDYYLIKRQQIDVDALFNDGPTGRYWYNNGVNWVAVQALVVAALAGLCFTFIPWFKPMANFAWFTGCFLGGGVFYGLSLWSRRSVPIGTALVR